MYGHSELILFFGLRTQTAALTVLFNRVLTHHLAFSVTNSAT